LLHLLCLLLCLLLRVPQHLPCRWRLLLLLLCLRLLLLQLLFRLKQMLRPHSQRHVFKAQQLAARKRLLSCQLVARLSGHRQVGTLLCLAIQLFLPLLQLLRLLPPRRGRQLLLALCQRHLLLLLRMPCSCLRLLELRSSRLLLVPLWRLHSGLLVCRLLLGRRRRRHVLRHLLLLLLMMMIMMTIMLGGCWPRGQRLCGWKLASRSHEESLIVI
jgi:Ca2+/Na+ antiporter